MSGFNSGAIDPALLSSNGVGNTINSSQLLNHRSINHQSTNSTLNTSSTSINPSSSNSSIGNQTSSQSFSINHPSQSNPNPNPSTINHSSLSNAIPAHLQTTIHPSTLSSPTVNHTSLATSQALPPSLNGANPSSSSTPVTNDPFHSNGMSLKEQEMHQKDQELAQFLLKMDDYKPVIPDEVAAYYLQRVGFECTDVRIQRLLALACQKFVADIAQDAFGYARTRTGQAPGGRQGPLIPNANSANLSHPHQPGTNTRKDRTRTVLTQEDLSQALGEYGINASRAPYYL
ncbi:transcription initiation factor TFIID 23-30kDa subunit-domain-containing protein [Melampsora americana]|nr:transcription initiation factor TFIID 23-30kDa subunit-domain-containing protein [Melampsora americana]